MNLFSFYYKSVYRNRINYLPIVILLMIPLFILYFNSLTNSLLSSVQQEIDSSEHLLLSAQNVEQTNALEQQINENIDFLEAYNKGEFSEAYVIRRDKLSRIKDLDLLSGQSTKESQDVLNRLILEFDALSKINVEFDSQYGSIHGFNHTLFTVMNQIIPIIFTAIIALFASELFTLNYHEGVDIERTYPIKQATIQLIKTASLCVVSIVLYFLFIVINFATSSVLFGRGSLDYPLIGFTQDSLELTTYTLKDIILPGFALQILSIILIVCLAILLAKWVHNKLHLFFLLIAIIYFQSIIIEHVPIFWKIVHFFPLYYLNVVDVLSFSGTQQMGNMFINKQNGILILLLHISIVVVFLYLYNSYNFKRRKKNE